jgi:hypothetical protein
MKRPGLAILLSTSLFYACGDDVPASDAGPSDSGVMDSGRPDGGSSDSGTSDTGATDTGVIDTGAVDTGVVDAGVADSGDDAGVDDAGPTDSGIVDSGPMDAGFVEHLEAVGILANRDLVSIDLTTGATTTRGTLEASLGDLYRMAYDSATGTIYALSDFTDAKLLVIDPCTVTATVVGTITPDSGNLFYVEGAGFNPNDGQLYISGSANGDTPADFSSETLFTLSTTTAVATPLVVVSGTWQGQDADDIGWVGTQGYLGDGDGASSTHLHTFDPSTGVATDLGALSTGVSWSVPLDGSSSGNVYGRVLNQLYQVDVTTRVATAIGNPLSENYSGAAIVDIDCPL